MENILTPEITQALFQVLGTILGIVLLLIGRLVTVFLIRKLGQAKYDQLMVQADLVIRYLDQFGANIGLGTNEQKKIYATNRLFEYSEKLGLGLTMEDISVIIEATVHAVKQRDIPLEVEG